ncbi:uncharacterized protein B0T15DRAFT_267502 [Chaetomium strumarium]|uniref:Uncharacterized protein n=1 Tax=Chaetomium strumarium TaxID=1170767 RepID=A0AAJ0GNJ2_9PEZI|nr:hypothetical protein B0T15DRAFT_267502 [Chaetomium strumarium]
MSDHYETMAKYLYDCGWETIAKRPLRHRDTNPEDTNMETRTFLNYLTVQDAGLPPPSRPTQAKSAVAEKARDPRKVSFAPDTQEPVARSRRYYSASPPPRSSTGSSERVAGPKRYSASPLRRLPGPSRPSSRSISPITSPRTFSSRAFKLSVPWPSQASPVEWYGVVPVLRDQATHAVLSHCAPWSWVSDPVPSAAEEQALWQQIVYRPIDLAAKLWALNRHNAGLRRSLESFATSLHIAANHASAAITSTLMIPPSRWWWWYQDHFEDWVWTMWSVRARLEKLLKALKKALARREEMVRLMDKIKALATELLLLAATAEPEPEPKPKHTLAVYVYYLLRLFK